jgi:hypothetical protein
VEARPAIVAHQGPPLAQSIVGPLHADFVQAHNEASWRAIGNFNGFWRLLRGLRLPDTRVLGLRSNQSPAMAAIATIFRYAMATGRATVNPTLALHGALKAP